MPIQSLQNILSIASTVAIDGASNIGIGVTTLVAQNTGQKAVNYLSVVSFLIFYV